LKNANFKFSFFFNFQFSMSRAINHRAFGSPPSALSLLPTASRLLAVAAVMSAPVVFPKGV
jgi:hypothetical protein